ncbi:MAG: Xaa-Pro peptidase family protein [Ahrensia sp.]|nr:Xaa-Pro peptidase family protein [Ahrensia sp.]
MDFSVDEYQRRVEAAQRLMRTEGFDALLFTSEAEIRYFSGFRTQFWQSPARPWFLIVPVEGAPIAVIPEIGADLMRRGWIDDVRVWLSPAKHDDGLSLLASALEGFETVGMPMGRESQLRMPLRNFFYLQQRLRHIQFVDCSALMTDLRFVKSEAEIDLIEKACSRACDAFDRAPDLFHAGQPVDEVFRAFKMTLLEAGLDDVPYLVGGKGPTGYVDVISPPSREPLRPGDVLMLDTGATVNGYFCDFDRNFAVERASDAVQRAHETLWLATQAGLEAARPGASCADVFAAMHVVIARSEQTAETGGVGRYGHGLGMQLTEQPSIIDWDETVLREGAVITLEPSMTVSGGGMLVHEENIVIRDGEAQLLTRRAPRELVAI